MEHGGEPLSQVAQWLGAPWWLFAVASQVLVVAVTLAGLWGVHWWQSGAGTRRIWRRWRPLPEQWILTGLPVAAGAMIALCALYCLFWWPKPPVARILEPDASILCWLYCGVFLTAPWAIATMANGLALVAAGALLSHPTTRRAGARLGVAAGLLAFPLGLLGVYAGLRLLRPGLTRGHALSWR